MGVSIRNTMWQQDLIAEAAKTQASRVGYAKKTRAESPRSGA